MALDRIADALAVVAGGVLVWRWRREMRAWTWLDRCGAVVLVPALVVFARVALRVVVGALGVDWNGSRLAPAVALARGYRLYYPASEGPVLDTLYGPVTALLYMPVALFRSPTPVILVGAAMNLAFVTVPLLAFTHRVARAGGAGELRAVTAWLGACLLMTWMPGPYYWLSMTHADAPALAFGLLACLAILPRSGESAPSTGRLVTAALLATLSAWTKQTGILLGVSLLPFVALAYGRGATARYAAALLVTALATAALFTAAFGFRPIWFNLVTVPSRQPWYFPGASGLLHVASWMFRAARPVLALLVLAALARLGLRPRFPRAALVPLLPALFLIPSGLLGANKFGGNENSFHSLYFLLASALVLLVADGAARAARACGYAFCAVALLLAWRHGYCKLGAPAPGVLPNPHQQAYDFARAHPGTTYFPAHPLATLLAEGKLYHLAYGVFDRTLGGYPPTADHFRENIPRRLEYVAIRGSDRKAMSYLPEFTEVRTSEELPGWTILARAGGERPTEGVRQPFGVRGSAATTAPAAARRARNSSMLSPAASMFRTWGSTGRL